MNSPGMQATGWQRSSRTVKAAALREPTGDARGRARPTQGLAASGAKSARGAGFLATAALVVGLLLALWPSVPAVAQTSPAPDEAARAEARERFARALELYEEGLLEQSLEEFRRAYEIAPALQVLYNLGQVYAALGRAVEAVETLERYLAEGGASIPADRRTEVEAELRRQRPRIASVSVRVQTPPNVEAPQVEVFVDGTSRGAPSTEPLRVTSGSVLLEVRAAGFEPFDVTLRLAGGVTETVTAVLRPIAVATGLVRVISSTAGATVLLDDREVGTTPLAEPLAVSPGAHVVEVRLAGFAPIRRELGIGAGEQEDVRADFSVMRIDPSSAGTLQLLLPVPATNVTIDGESLEPADAYPLPPGPHALSITVPDRLPFSARVEVTTGQTHELRPTLRWADEDVRLAASRGHQETAWITFAVGGGFTLLAIPFLAAAVQGQLEWQAIRSSPPCSEDPDCTQRDAGGLASFADTPTSWAVAAGSLLIGLVLETIGVAMLLDSRSDRTIIDGASVRVAIGPGGLEGRF